MVGSERQKSTLSWLGFQMRIESKLLFCTSREKQSFGGEALDVVLHSYHGTNSVLCWVTDSMRHPYVMLLDSSII